MVGRQFKIPDPSDLPLKEPETQCVADLEQLLGVEAIFNDRAGDLQCYSYYGYLTSLRIWGDQFHFTKVVFPKSIGYCAQLSLLYMEYLNIGELPVELGELKNLRTLGIVNTFLPPLPGTIGNLKKLERLRLDSNNLNEIPSAIGTMSNLKEIYIANNRIRSLPEEIGNLVKLRSFRLGNNLQGCPNLESLPDSFGNLKQLESLSIGGNALTDLPESIGELKNLKQLLLGGNLLTTLPPSFWNLTNLQILDLTKNRLMTFPKQIVNLKSLKFLALSGNKDLSITPDEQAILKEMEERGCQIAGPGAARYHIPKIVR